MTAAERYHFFSKGPHNNHGRSNPMSGTMNPSTLLAWRNARDAFDKWQEAEAKAQALLAEYQLCIADLSVHFVPQYDGGGEVRRDYSPHCCRCGVKLDIKCPPTPGGFYCLACAAEPPPPLVPAHGSGEWQAYGGKRREDDWRCSAYRLRDNAVCPLPVGHAGDHVAAHGLRRVPRSL